MKENYPKVLECGCLQSLIKDEGFNRWAELSEGTEMIYTRFCESHKGIYKIKKEVEGYKL